MLDSANLSDIAINSVRISTTDTSHAEWTTPQIFASYAKKSNVIIYYLGSSTSITLTASSDTMVRSDPFTATVSGLPNTPDLI